ncbi:ABC transporter permease subunit [Herbidospora sp. NEAU-GS84]|uniref:ABC transporter permease subunit n=1 Tax=Herbidospora solisilvae TaxID=2696284 RepID=A0A7C9NBI1_9ACTN|nr:ABC transporter permease [Herbidospora solisilvae]NAS20375.1 ABC transporter permease subunit [Herbidospora solisilvae]
MTNLIRAELQKLFTTRLWWAMALVMLALTTLGLAFLIAQAGAPAPNGQPALPALDDPAWLPLALSNANGNIFTMILGIVLMTGEYRYQTITGTFLTTPKRGRVIAAKLGAGVIIGAFFAVVSLLFTAVVAVTAVLIGGGTVDLTANRIPQLAVGVLATMILYALFGIGLGALVRNQVAALIGGVVWAFVIESILSSFPALQAVGKWLPGGAAQALMSIDFDTGLGESNLLPAWGGALVLIGYALLFAVIANLTTTRRDIT